jgi:YceI-like domain
MPNALVREGEGADEPGSHHDPRRPGGQRPPGPEVGSYAIDPTHASFEFVARHLMAKTRGRFCGVSGVATIAERPEDSTLKVEIDTSTVDTGDATRDAHLLPGGSRSARSPTGPVHPRLARPGLSQPRLHSVRHPVAPCSPISQPISGLGLGPTGAFVNAVFVLSGLVLLVGVAGIFQTVRPRARRSAGRVSAALLAL